MNSAGTVLASGSPENVVCIHSEELLLFIVLTLLDTCLRSKNMYIANEIERPYG